MPRKKKEIKIEQVYTLEKIRNFIRGYFKDHKKLIYIFLHQANNKKKDELYKKIY